MPTHSSLARLLQFTTVSAALLALAWIEWHGSTRPGLAALGALLIFFGYSPVLALEFALLRSVVKDDPAAPPPTPAQLLRAWWSETVFALRVFYWRQPFFWRAEPDFLGPGVQGRRGVVFIHGFVCNRGFWTPWLERLRARGHAFAAVNLEPVFASIDDYPPIVEAAVRRIIDATGLPPVLVCHSMGGLAARAWLRQPGARNRVQCVVTIGTPHQGTWLARFSHTTTGRQMRPGGEWLRQLERDEAARPRPPFVCWYSHCDNVVFPPIAATLRGADNRHVAGAPHVGLAFRPRVMDETIAMLSR